jgi:hypothetical protein
MFQTLQHAIKEVHGCDSRHVESVSIHEVFQGGKVWRGTVEVFDLIGHPKAKRVYAWSFKDGNKIVTAAVLQLPPVDSPQSAVELAIIVKARRR